MLKLETVRFLMRDTRLRHLQRETGISMHTLFNIKEGRSQDPRFSTVEKLSDYFEERDETAREFEQ